MYPVMFGVLMQQVIERSTRAEREGVDLAVIGASRAPTLMAQLKQKNITVIDTAPMDEAAIETLLQKGKVAGLLRLDGEVSPRAMPTMRPAKIELWYDSASRRTVRSQRDSRGSAVEAYSSANVAGARLLAHGVSPAVHWRRCGCSATTPAATPRARPA
jgi:sodium transport system permease protein